VLTRNNCRRSSAHEGIEHQSTDWAACHDACFRELLREASVVPSFVGLGIDTPNIAFVAICACAPVHGVQAFLAASVAPAPTIISSILRRFLDGVAIKVVASVFR